MAQAELAEMFTEEQETIVIKPKPPKKGRTQHENKTTNTTPVVQTEGHATIGGGISDAIMHLDV